MKSKEHLQLKIENEIRDYIFDDNKEKIGVFTAGIINNKVTIGWSIVHPCPCGYGRLEIHHEKRGYEIALGRAKKNAMKDSIENGEIAFYIPHHILEGVDGNNITKYFDKFRKRCISYYKNMVIPNLYGKHHQKKK